MLDAFFATNSLDYHLDKGSVEDKDQFMPKLPGLFEQYLNEHGQNAPGQVVRLVFKATLPDLVKIHHPKTVAEALLVFTDSSQSGNTGEDSQSSNIRLSYSPRVWPDITLLQPLMSFLSSLSIVTTEMTHEEQVSSSH